jgi:hypothetical protein
MRPLNTKRTKRGGRADTAGTRRDTTLDLATAEAAELWTVARAQMGQLGLQVADRALGRGNDALDAHLAAVDDVLRARASTALERAAALRRLREGRRASR